MCVLLPPNSLWMASSPTLKCASELFSIPTEFIPLSSVSVFVRRFSFVDQIKRNSTTTYAHASMLPILTNCAGSTRHRLSEMAIRLQDVSLALSTRLTGVTATAIRPQCCRNGYGTFSIITAILSRTIRTGMISGQLCVQQWRKTDLALKIPTTILQLVLYGTGRSGRRNS